MPASHGLSTVKDSGLQNSTPNLQVSSYFVIGFKLDETSHGFENELDVPGFREKGLVRLLA